MVAHSTPKAGVEWGTQSLGRGTEGRALLSQLATASQTARDDNGELSPVEKHFQEGSAELQIPRLRSPGFPVELCGV
jgi:hypothetical protein